MSQNVRKICFFFTKNYNISLFYPFLNSSVVKLYVLKQYINMILEPDGYNDPRLSVLNNRDLFLGYFLWFTVRHGCLFDHFSNIIVIR